jgi:hypothetical protein
VKTADLRIEQGQHAFFAECKRKEKYGLPDVDVRDWPGLQRDIFDLLTRLSANYEITIIALGRFEAGDGDEILHALHAAVAKGFEGGPLTRKGASQAIYLRKISPSELGAMSALRVTPGEGRRGEAYVDIDDAGVVRGARAVWLYAINSHRLASLIDSFNLARTQLPAGDSGVIYIDLDVSEVEDRDLEPYFNSAGSALGQLFSPTSNTRVAAVVLTSVAIFRPVKDPSGREVMEPHIYYNIIRNPFHAGAQFFPIPPERLPPP